MEKKFIYLYVLDSMADWEPGYAIAELNSGRYFRKDAPRFIVKTLGINKDTITTLGGVNIIPDSTIDQVDPDNTALLILPGADTWHQSEHSQVLTLAQNLLNRQIAVGAICGATIALANAGMLDGFKHTSNNRDFLIQTCPKYNGTGNYIEKPAVSDRQLVTASGTAPLEFAHEIFSLLGVFKESTLEAWYSLYQTKQPRYFFELMESVAT